MIPGEATYRIVKSRKGPDTILVASGGREIPLHSAINPEREGRAFDDRFDPARYDLLIVLGTGLGYHLTGLKDRIGDYSRVICIDILEGIEGHIGSNPLTSFLVESPGVALIAGKSTEGVEAALAEMIDLDAVRGVSVIEHPASLNAFRDYYEKVRSIVQKLINMKAGNKATRKAFGALYLRNILRNYGLLGGVAPVKYLFDAFRGNAAVIAASGPSLDGDMGALRLLQKRFFIVAVDSALPALIGNGVSPDIVVTIDPQPWVYEHFQGCNTGDAAVVCSITSPPSILGGAGIYCSLNSHPFSQLAREAYGDGIGSIDSATGSVAGDAINLCLKCGFSAIGLTGLDFSFSDYAIYARGTAYQRRYAVYFQDRFSTVEGRNCRYILQSSGGLKQEGKFTRRSFLNYRQALEGFLSESRAGKLFTLNDRGMPLSGVEMATMEEFAARHGRDGIDKKKIIDGIRGASRTLSVQTALGTLGVAAGEDLFGELIAASLGEVPGERERFRYQAMIRSLLDRGGE